MSKMGEKFTEQQAREHMNKVWVTHWDNRFDPPLPYYREKGAVIDPLVAANDRVKEEVQA